MSSDVFNVGADPLSYSGIAVMPPAIKALRAPTTADIGYEPGQIWVDTPAGAVYILASNIANVATWNLSGAGSSGGFLSITGDSGGPEVPTGGGNFNILGTANQITVAGSANTETLSLSATLVAPGSITSTTGITAGTTLTSAGATTLATTGASVNTFGNTTGATSVAISVGAAAFSVDGVTSSTYAIGASTTTGTITIGGTAQTGTITLGSSSGTNIVAIGAGAGATTVNIANGATNAKAVNIATGAVANVVTIGSTSGAASLTERVGTGNYSLDGAATSTYTIGASTTSGTITIGGTAQTGDMVLGSSSGTNAVKIANGAGATTVSIAAVQVAGAVNIGTAMTTGTVSVGGTAGTGLIAIGLATNATGQTVAINNAASNTGANVVNILNGATPGANTTLNIMNGAGTAGTQTVNILAAGATRAGAVNIGTGAAAHAITIGQVTTTVAINGPQTNTLASGAAVGLTVNTSAGTGRPVSLTSSAVTVPDLASNVGGILVTPSVVAAGASPQVANNRHFDVTFSGVSIAAAADQTLTITNSTISGAATSIMLTMSGATTGSALSIKSITPGAGTVAIVVTNGTGATTSTANIRFIGWVMN